jgi:hypothetical protein
MMDGRRFLISFVVGLAISAGASADMMPVCSHDVALFHARTAPQCSDTPCPSDLPGVGYLDGSGSPLLPDAPANVQRNHQIPQPQVLTNGESSLSLCLSALMGLGLCGSAGWLKRLHFGFIPDWYHDGGPHQIGHSHAVNPNTLCIVPVRCFIQPAHDTAQYSLAQYRLKVMISLRRESQFTPNVLASRGPPITS